MSLFFCAQNFFFFCAYQGWGWLAPRPSAAIFTPIYTLKKHSKNVLIYSSSSIRIDLNYWPTRQITTAAVANGNKNLPPLNARAHTHEHLDKRLARPFRDRKGKKTFYLNIQSECRWKYIQCRTSPPTASGLPNTFYGHSNLIFSLSAFDLPAFGALV